MTRPKQGYLKFQNSQWTFQPGNSRNPKCPKPAIPLPHFLQEAPKLIDSHLLKQGGHAFTKFLDKYHQHQLQTPLLRRMVFHNTTDPSVLTSTATKQALEEIPAVQAYCQRVSATNLSSTIKPKLHEHHLLPPKDKDIWDKSYMEEYLGLHLDSETWEYLSKEDYQRIKKVVGRPLPTMALSKIKTDKHGNPEHAKYRIVVLGNLDPHQWSSTDCFAPVLSALELCILIALATQLKVVPKTGDVSQAFVQSVLPPDEKYVCTPPKGCPITPPNTYLLLKKTLYSLKRSPRHWYNTCKKAFIKLGLCPLPNAPCIFSGVIIPNHPPLYLGLYVNDFVFFSKSPLVETTFQNTFNDIHKADFQPQISHFLGVNFTIKKHQDEHLDIFMNQPNDVDNALQKCKLDTPDSKPAPTPYRSGYPVDAIPDNDLSLQQAIQNNACLQELNGIYNWMATQTRLDISTIVNILAQYNHKCSSGHLKAAKHVARYLKGTSQHGITFSSRSSSALNSFVKFPISQNTLTPLTDANWGPQDASVPSPNQKPIQLDLFKSRSIAGYVIWLGGPLHWSSKRQSYTARSSAEKKLAPSMTARKNSSTFRTSSPTLTFSRSFPTAQFPFTTITMQLSYGLII